jgi:UDP-2,4-diacetamido-2,4,6-trideoxy-beta-L-altropyranose hydrolase
MGLRSVLWAMNTVILAKDGGPVSLRQAAADDVTLVYEWQRHPDTRRFARNPEAPGLEEHRSWFSGRLASLDCILSIIMHGDEPAGMLRLDRRKGRASEAWEVSILTAPEKKRLGLARAALEMARGRLPDAELIAEVLPGNNASHRLFRDAGYVMKDDGLYHSMPVQG